MPFLNATVLWLLNWFYQGSTKTLAALQSLVNNVILHPDFHSSNLKNFSASRKSQWLEKLNSVPDSNLPYLKNDDWKESLVKVPLPLAQTQHPTKDDAPMLEIKFVHWDLCELIKSGIQDFANSHNFHWHGFKQFWKPSEGKPEQQVYGEVYTSDAFLEMESMLPHIEGCTLEKAVIPLIVYSDSTHLSNFGTVSLWPIYIWFGSISKYIQLRTLSFSAHHLAYLPLVSNWLCSSTPSPYYWKANSWQRSSCPFRIYIQRPLARLLQTLVWNNWSGTPCTQYGQFFCSLQTSRMHSRLVSLSAVAMGSGGNYSPISLHTQWTMLKGVYKDNV